MAQTIRDVTTPNPVALQASSPINEAARQMKQRDIGDVIVLDGGKPVGIGSIGDLAVDRDPESALAEINGAPGNT